MKKKNFTGTKEFHNASKVFIYNPKTPYERANHTFDMLGCLVNLLCPNCINSDIDYLEENIIHLEEMAKKFFLQINIFKDLEALYFESGEKSTKLLVERIKISYKIIIKRFLEYYNKKTLKYAISHEYLYKTTQLKHIIYNTRAEIINTMIEIQNFEKLYLQKKTATKKLPPPQQLIIPDNILNELKRLNYIEKVEAYPLKWLESKSLLAYFVDVANDKLNLKKGQKRQIKLFEEMFNETGLTGCINEYKNKTGQLPQGYKDIDKLFM